MRSSDFLIKTGAFLGLLLIGRTLFSRRTLSPAELLRRIEVRCIAAKKSAQLAVEKSTSSFLRDISQHLYNDLVHESEELSQSRSEDESSQLLKEAESFRFTYDYNEESPFDLAFASHQINECDDLVLLLQQIAHMHNGSIKEIALRRLAIFSRYQAELNTFWDNFLKINEYRIRELAYQIWEAEGRPEGQHLQHWKIAVELLKSTSPADLQLAFEQKRSLIDSFSTTPHAVNKYLH